VTVHRANVSPKNGRHKPQDQSRDSNSFFSANLRALYVSELSLFFFFLFLSFFLLLNLFDSVPFYPR
jgi:hypothetical protein